MQVSYLFNQHDPSYKAVCALITKEIVKTSKLPNLVGLGPHPPAAICSGYGLVLLQPETIA